MLRLALTILLAGPTLSLGVHKEPGRRGCTREQWRCQDGDCIGSSYRCDREENCKDGSDEMDCPTMAPIGDLEKAMKSLRNVISEEKDNMEMKLDLFPGNSSCDSAYEWQCDSGDCVSSIKLCDREEDCPGGSDEWNCTHFCRPGQFLCNNTNCINGNYLCDGDNDCNDDSDEAMCDSPNTSPNPSSESCNFDQFQCANGDCITKLQRCDEQDDCSDKSDEENCIAYCDELQFYCDNGKCISGPYMCDGDNDCGDNSDEDWCPTGSACRYRQFECANGNCINADYKCDDDNDCGDGSDEEGCFEYGDWNSTSSLVVLNGNCSESETPCVNNSTCTDVDDGFTCTCVQGFFGDSCEHTWMKECETPCEDDDCQRMKMTVDALLDMDVNPCDDFYAFACKASGRGTNPPPERKPIISFVNLVKHPPEGFEYIKNFYKSCTMVGTGWTTEEILFECMMDGNCEEDELSDWGKIFPQFLQYAKTFMTKAYFPAITPNWEELTKDWNAGEGWTWWNFAAQTLQENYFFGAFHYSKGDVMQGEDVFRAHLFFVPFIDTTLTGDGLETADLDHKLYIVPMRVPRKLREKDEAWVAKYKMLMRTVISFLGQSHATLDEDVEKIVEWELKIAKVTEHEYTPDSSWQTVTIKELYDLNPHVEWMDYLRETLKKNPEIRIQRNTRVLIPSRGSFKLMGELVKEIEVNRRDQANLLIWRMMINFANDFMHTGGGDSTDLSDDIFSTISESGSEGASRATNCLTQIKTLFPAVEHDMFVAHYISKEEKRTMKAMFDELKAAFRGLVDEATWMTRRTKIRAKRKLNAVTITVGETTPQTPEYETLKQRITGNDYIGNVLAIGKYRWETEVKEFLEQKKIFNDGEEKDVNAFYAPSYNHVHIKTGLINGMLNLGFSLGFPPSLLYGGFMVLGHELTHGFDTRGRLYDRQGNRLDWWEPSDEKEFLRRTECLRNQYENYTISYRGRNYTLDRCENQGENIADNGGLKVIYRSFHNNPRARNAECLPGIPLTASQLFWLGYAMEWCLLGTYYTEYPRYERLLSRPSSYAGHSPPPWRVNVVLSNQPEFARDFNCPVGSKMNPPDEERCAVW